MPKPTVICPIGSGLIGAAGAEGTLPVCSPVRGRAAIALDALDRSNAPRNDIDVRAAGKMRVMLAKALQLRPGTVSRHSAPLRKDSPGRNPWQHEADDAAAGR